MYSEEYEKRWAELRRWSKSDLVFEAAALGYVGPIASWSVHDLQKAILRLEFPAEASNG